MTTPRPVGCDSFEEFLPDYVDGTLDDLSAELAAAHLAQCARCTELVRGLEDVRDRAAELPVLRPSRDLWAGISARIATPVRTLESRRPRPSVWVASVSVLRRHAVAAALVVATAGVTYTVTRLTAPVAVPQHVAVVAPVVPSVSQPVTPPPAQPLPSSPVVAVAAKKPTATYTYDQEITQLHKIVIERQDQLDPRTLAVIRRNLAVIDSAITESRKALAHDPKSAFLADQLDHALDTKLELLRTAALLPART